MVKGTKKTKSPCAGYGWVNKLKKGKHPPPPDKINNLCREVTKRRRIGMGIKWSLIVGDIILLILLFLLVRSWNKIVITTSQSLSLIKGLNFDSVIGTLSTPIKFSIINGFIAFELAIVAVLSKKDGSLRGVKFNLSDGCSITGKEVKDILKRPGLALPVPAPIVEEINKNIKPKTSGTQGLLTFIGAVGVFFTIFLQFIL